jgi:small subunit ribosomal protein S9
MVEKPKKNQYIEAVGRRKSAVARVRLSESPKTSYSINDKELTDYFPTSYLKNLISEPFKTSGLKQKYSVSALIKGGGVNSQAEALRHGISRAIVSIEGDLRKGLKKAGFLKRDPRKKERKKFGLKKSRKSAQWSKR